jgi:putative transposase
MARLARIVVPDLAHHVTQRGNRRQSVFISDEDYHFTELSPIPGTLY